MQHCVLLPRHRSAPSAPSSTGQAAASRAGTTCTRQLGALSGRVPSLGSPGREPRRAVRASHPGAGRCLAHKAAGTVDTPWTQDGQMAVRSGRRVGRFAAHPSARRLAPRRRVGPPGTSILRRRVPSVVVRRSDTKVAPLAPAPKVHICVGVAARSAALRVTCGRPRAKEWPVWRVRLARRERVGCASLGFVKPPVPAGITAVPLGGPLIAPGQMPGRKW